MKIEHIALWTNNLETLRDFYVRYFNGVTGEKYRNAKTNFESYFISFSDGSRLEIMTRPDLVSAPPDSSCLGYAHIAFSVGSRENVDALTERLRGDGFSVTGEPRTTGDGYYESVIRDPCGNLIEITL